METVKDRFSQEMAQADTIVFMRSSGNYLELGIITEITGRKAKIITADGYKSTFDLSRSHRVIKTTDTLHTKTMAKVLERALGKKMKETSKKIDLDFLKI